jgi:hypothetical protein
MWEERTTSAFKKNKKTKEEIVAVPSTRPQTGIRLAIGASAPTIWILHLETKKPATLLRRGLPCQPSGFCIWRQKNLQLSCEGGLPYIWKQEILQIKQQI